jgi:hypothetical protein
MAAGAFTAGLESQPAMRYAVLTMKSGVALEAKLASLTPHQEHAVGVSVRVMARRATFHFDRRVFVDIRTALLGMAVRASLKIRLVQAGVIQ